MKKILTFALSSILILNISEASAQSHPFTESATQASAKQNQSNGINWLTSYSSAVSLSQSNAKPIVILFTGTGWCPACMKLERDVISHPEFAQAVGQKFVFLKAEFPDYSEGSVSASPYKALLDRYSVKEFPTLVVINANGQLLYTVKYKQGGPQAYTQELLQKLQQSGTSR